MSRRDEWRIELLDRRENVKASRLKVTAGSLRWSAGQLAAGTGSLTVTLPPDAADAIDWHTDRIRVTHVDRTVERVHGIWIPQVAGRTVEDAVTRLTVPVADKTELYNRPVGAWLTYPSGSVVTDLISTILAGRGEQALQVTASSATLAKAWSCGPEETWLSVINTLAATINYAPLRASLDGVLVVAPAVPLEQSPSVATYGGQPDHLRLKPDWSVDTDLYALPTGVVVYVARPDGLKGWIGRADLPDDHPLSAANRGERLVTETGNTTTLAATQARAELRLAELTQASASIQIQHPIDDTGHMDVVTVDPEGAVGQIVDRSITLGVGAVVQSTIKAGVEWM